MLLGEEREGLGKGGKRKVKGKGLFVLHHLSQFLFLVSLDKKHG